MVWLTTFDGRLLCYDGGVFRLIQKLSVRFFRGLCLDGAGRLWMGTYGVGLYCYDTTRFEVFQDVQGLPSNQVYCMTEDAKGVLWVGTQAGLVGYDGTRFRLLEGTGELTGKPVLGLLRNSRDHLWIGSWDTLYRYKGKVLQPVPTPSQDRAW